MKRSKVWVGLVGMRPNNQNTFLGAVKGAYTTMFVFTAGYKGYIKQVEQFLKESDIELMGIEDIEPFESRAYKYEVSTDMINLSKLVKKDGIIRFNRLDLY